MVRRLVILAVLALGCRKAPPMVDKVEMPHPDSAVLSSPARMDSMLDTMPGGLMVKGNDSAARKLIKKKM